MNKKIMSVLLVISLGFSCSVFSGKEKLGRGSFFKKVGISILSIGALGGSGVAWSWANKWDVRKTLKPVIQTTFFGSLGFALYRFFVKPFVKKEVVKIKVEVENMEKKVKSVGALAKKELNDISGIVVNKVKDVQSEINTKISKQLKGISDAFDFYSKRINPLNLFQKSHEIRQELQRKEDDKEMLEVKKDLEKYGGCGENSWGTSSVYQNEIMVKSFNLNDSICFINEKNDDDFNNLSNAITDLKKTINCE
ncbi:hypothetical protein KAH94_02695 [bacterium]|nr:hypothetical protein [bacterium]